MLATFPIAATLLTPACTAGLGPPVRSGRTPPRPPPGRGAADRTAIPAPGMDRLKALRAAFEQTLAAARRSTPAKKLARGLIRGRFRMILRWAQGRRFPPDRSSLGAEVPTLAPRRFLLGQTVLPTLVRLPLARYIPTPPPTATRLRRPATTTTAKVASFFTATDIYHVASMRPRVISPRKAYFLADAKGNRQEKAPADIVTDDTHTRGVEIRNTISCIGCHTDAIRHPTLDSYREYVLSGARIYVKDKATQQEIDRYLDSPIAKEISRNNEDYAAGLALCNGLTPAENAAAFRAVVQRYDAEVTPEQAARELYTAPETWRMALGDYSRTYQLTGRLALMAQGQSISREQWKSNFALAQKVLAQWHATSQSH